MTTSSKTGPHVHLVGSVAMSDCEEVFTRVSAELGPHLLRIPDGETGERSRWIYFQREMLLEHPAMEVDPTVPEFELRQWDGRLMRSLPLVRFREDVDPDAVEFPTGYDEAATYSYGSFKVLRDQGVIPPHARFQVCLPTPMASSYFYVSPPSRVDYERVYERSLLRALDSILDAIPEGDLAIQFDVCQEVLLFEGYFEHRPDNYKELVFSMLARLAARVPDNVELGFHLCYGSPFDEPVVRPEDMTIVVELANGISSAVERRVDFVHIPVPQGRTDIGFFRPLSNLNVRPDTELFLGLVQPNDNDGNRERIDIAKQFVESFGVATECGWGRMDPENVPGLLASHRMAAESLV